MSLYRCAVPGREDVHNLLCSIGHRAIGHRASPSFFYSMIIEATAVRGRIMGRMHVLKPQALNSVRTYTTRQARLSTPLMSLMSPMCNE